VRKFRTFEGRAAPTTSVVSPGSSAPKPPVGEIVMVPDVPEITAEPKTKRIIEWIMEVE
jgi:hypothetical protein